MSLVARMKEQFKGQGGVTPEAHKVLIKTQKEKEEQAVNIAKARAARYNLTLRTAELQTKTPPSTSSSTSATSSQPPRPDPSKIVKGTTADDFKKKKGEEGEKPNPFKVQLKKVGAPNPKVAEALHHNRAPSVAKAVVEAAAVTNSVAPAVAAAKEEIKIKAKTVEQITILEAKHEETKEVVVVEVHEKVVAVLEEAKVEVTADVVQTIRTEAAPSVVGQEFEMTSLKQALEEGNSEKINEAVVTEFLETHAPEMVSEVPKLLEEFKGNEAGLMEKLADEHPDPAEKIEADAAAIISGSVTPSAEEKKEIEQHHNEEAAKVAVMSEEDRKEYEATKSALEEHAIAKDDALKEELQAMREVAKTMDASAEEGATLGGFIISGVNNGGEWQVNQEEGAASSE